MRPCTECGRPALFNTDDRAAMRSDMDHTLCQRCFKAILQPIAASTPRPRYRAMNFKRVAPCIPVDKAAARVTSAGSHYEPELDPTIVLSDVPLPTRPWPNTADRSGDIKGRTFGRLTVMGLSFDKLGGRWVCRCTCGKYLYRRGASLKKVPQGREEHMCDRCDALEQHKLGFGDFGLHSKNLRHAAMPMYLALKEILKYGLTPATIHSAVEAMAEAEQGRMEATA